MLDRVQDLPRCDSRSTPSVYGVGWLAGVAVALLVVAACSVSRPTPQPTPGETTPSTTAEAPTAAALATYGEFWRISEEAFAAPAAQDWRAELSKVARGQAIDDVMLEIRNYASVPAHVEGTVARSPIVDPSTSPTTQRVAILDCIDLSDSRLLADSDGSVLDDVKNRPKRYRFRAQVVKNTTGQWLVETTAPALAEPC